MRKSTLLCRALFGGALALASLAYAMPSEREIKTAKPIVDSLIADDMEALKKKTKQPAEVAAAQYELVEKAESEAGKFLLLQSVFRIYARNGLYDEAGNALERLSTEIAELPPEEVMKMVDGAMGRADPEKASKVLSIYKEAKRKVDCRKRLTSARAELKKKPSNTATIRTIGDCHVGLGDWPKALKAYDQLGFAAAKYELSPETATNYGILDAADFWWDYKTADPEPFKVHAAELYRSAVEKGIASGLRREMALKRIEDAKQFSACQVQPRQPNHDQSRQTAADSTNARRAGKAPKHGDTKTLVLPGGAKLEMIYVAPGEFMMGSDDGKIDAKPAHKVKLTKGFWLGKYEVTQAQWQSIMGNNPSAFKGDDKPVDSVSWLDCQSFINKVNAQLNCGARLPTEAEWEYACRAGTIGSYASVKINNYAAEHPESVKTLYAMGWYDANSTASTHPVGKKQPNHWGFYDMHGNVWEWCSDRHGGYPSGSVTDPIGATSNKCIGRVLRGGSYNGTAKGCHSASRGWCRPHVHLDRYGFRLCCSVEPTE